MTTIPVQLRITAMVPGHDGHVAVQALTIAVAVPDSLVREVSGQSPDLSTVSTAELSAELARRLNAPLQARDYDDLRADEGPREPELRYPRPEPRRYTCRHGSREATPTAVFAGAIHTCRCCGLEYGSLNPEPADGLCEFCRSAEPVGFRCQHGVHAVEPVLYAGALPTCACCGAPQGELSSELPAPAPPPGWCSFCSDRWWTRALAAPRPDPSDPLPF